MVDIFPLLTEKKLVVGRIKDNAVINICIYNACRHCRRYAVYVLECGIGLASSFAQLPYKN